MREMAMAYDRRWAAGVFHRVKAITFDRVDTAVATRRGIGLMLARLKCWGRVMLWRAVILVSAALLSGCVSDGVGSDYASVAQKVGPPKAGQSRVVVFQEKRKGLSVALCACQMALDGNPIGRVIVGTYVYADRPAGRHQLVASETLFPGDTKRDFTTVSGRTYYFLIRSSERHDAVTGGTVVFGLAGALVTSAATAGAENQGPAELVLLDEPTAKIALAELELAQ
jgi:hypothetical protein